MKIQPTKRELIDQLIYELKKAGKAYYLLGEPIMTDAEYDFKKARLRKLSPVNPFLEEVGATPELINYERSIVMGSLNNVRTKEDLQKFFDKFPYVDLFFYTPKVDGIATELVYQDHEFAGGYTRGDGTVGQDVSLACLGINCIPRYIEMGGIWVVRGESYISHANFKEVNQRMIEQDQEPFTLPRSMAAGTLKLTDTKEVKRRKLSFVAWELVTGNKKIMREMNSENKRMSYVASAFNIPVVPRRKFDKNKDDLGVLLNELLTWRKQLPYPIDGIVFSINKIKWLEREGMGTSKCPIGKMAYKFPPVQKWTKVKKIVTQVGRTGKVTPVVVFDPIILDGSEVERASAHNFDEIARQHIVVGNKVLVEKACDIIPQIDKAEDEEAIVAEPPKVCPACGATLVKKMSHDKFSDTESVDLYCPNSKFCPSQASLRIVNFMKVLEFKGFGRKVIFKLMPYMKGGLETFFDIPLTDYISAISHKNGTKLYNVLHSEKSVSFPKFLQALGYNDMGEENAKVVARAFVSPKEIINSKYPSEIRLVLQAAGMKGDTTICSITKGLVEGQNEIAELCKRIKIRPMKSTEGLPLEGKSFVITGKLSESRTAFEKRIDKFGGDCVSKVTKKTSFLLVGADPGNEKLNDAERFGVKKITEEEFTEML